MKKWISSRPFACFMIFAILIAARDSFSQLLLDQNIDPFFMVFCFFSITSVLAFAYGKIFKLKTIPLAENFKEKALLGVITCSAFLLTLFGIKLIGASIFSLVEHCLIPISTFFLAVHLLKDNASKSMYVGIIISVVSVLLFLFAINDYEFIVFKKDWIAGILIAVLCSLLTSISSIFQKKLLLKNHEPYQVLLARFTLPSAMVFVFLLLKGVEIPGFVNVLKIVIISIFFFSLPLLLLLQGFVRSSMARFSIFNILIPSFTFLFNSLLFDNEFSKWSNRWVLLGTAGILVGHVIFEWEGLKSFLSRSKSG